MATPTTPFTLTNEEIAAFTGGELTRENRRQDLNALRANLELQACLRCFEGCIPPRNPVLSTPLDESSAQQKMLNRLKDVSSQLSPCAMKHFIMVSGEALGSLHVRKEITTRQAKLLILPLATAFFNLPSGYQDPPKEDEEFRKQETDRFFTDIFSSNWRKGSPLCAADELKIPDLVQKAFEIAAEMSRSGEFPADILRDDPKTARSSVKDLDSASPDVP